MIALGAEMTLEGETSPKLPTGLTENEQARFKDLLVLSRIAELDFWRVGELNPSDRKRYLDNAFAEIVRGRVISMFGLLEATAAYALTVLVLGDHGAPNVRLVFDRLIMDRISFIDKTEAIKKLTARTFEKGIDERISRINNCRNKFAHLLVPSSDWKAMEKSFSQFDKLGAFTYDDIDLYTIDGIRRFEDDVAVVLKAMEGSVSAGGLHFFLSLLSKTPNTPDAIWAALQSSGPDQKGNKK